MRGKRKYDSLQGSSDKILLLFFLLDTGIGKSRVRAKNVINRPDMHVPCSVLMMPCSNKWLKSSFYLNLPNKFVISNPGKHLSTKVRAPGLSSLGDGVTPPQHDSKTQLGFSTKLLTSRSKSSWKSTNAGKTKVSHRFNLCKRWHKMFGAPRHAEMLVYWYVSVLNVTQWACNSFQMLNNCGRETADGQTDHSCSLHYLLDACKPLWYH